MNRKTKLLGWRACLLTAPLAPPESSTIQRFPSESAWIPSYPPRPKMPDRSTTVEG
jgi:hypothetical protein